MYNIIFLCGLLVVIVLLILTIIKQKELFYSDKTITPSNAKSVISLNDGAILNIEQNNDGINIKIDNQGRYLALDDDNILKSSYYKNNINSQWEIIHVNNASTYNSVSPKNNNYNVNDDYYIVKSKKSNGFLLQYERGKVFVSAPGIYNSQKWNISNTELPQKQLKIIDIYDSPIGPISSNIEDDPNSVHLNLNINNDMLNKFFNNNDNIKDEPEVCDSYLSKEAVSSLCPGCNV